MANLIDSNKLEAEIMSIYVAPSGTYSSDPVMRELNLHINNMVSDMFQNFKLELQMAIARSTIDQSQYRIEKIDD